MYPVLTLARDIGWLDGYIEQVYLYTFLDCLAKCITFSSIVGAKLMLSLASINGSVQLVLAAHDTVLSVDEAFRVLAFVRHGPILSSLFKSSPERTLLDFCLNEEHTTRLELCARTADRQDFGEPSPKCRVTFNFPSDCGEVLAECMVSKCVQGRRVLGVAIITISGNSVFSQAVEEEDSVSLRSVETASEVTFVRNDEHTKQTRGSIHNCAGVLQLDSSVTSTLDAIFFASEADVALFCVDSNSLYEGYDVLILAASRSFSRRFVGMSMPCSLSTIVKDDDVQRLVSAVAFEELCVYQSSHVDLLNGTTVSLSALLLNRISPSPPAAGAMQLGVLCFEPSDTKTWAGDIALQHFWYNTGAQLHRLTCDTTCVVSPPIPTITPPLFGWSGGWHVAFVVPRERGGAAKTCPRAVYVLPWTATPELPQIFKRSWRLSADEAKAIFSSAEFPHAGHEVPPPRVLSGLGSCSSAPWVCFNSPRIPAWLDAGLRSGPLAT